MFAVVLLVLAASCGGSGGTSAPATYKLGGPYGGDPSGISCDWQGNAVTVRDGTGPVLGTTVMNVTNQVTSGTGCSGQASWSVSVPQPRSGYYRVEIETDMGGGNVTIKSDLIPFAEAKAAGFRLYLQTGMDGLDFSTARIEQVAPWTPKP